jgi:protein SCO1/2
MSAYLRDAHPRYTGLTGIADEIEVAKAAYHVFARRADEPDGDTVPHTSFTVLMGPDGDYLTHYPETLTSDDLADRLRAHLSAG